MGACASARSHEEAHAISGPSRPRLAAAVATGAQFVQKYRVRFRVFPSCENVAKCHGKAGHTDADGHANAAYDEKVFHARFLRSNAMRMLRETAGRA